MAGILEQGITQLLLVEAVVVRMAACATSSLLLTPINNSNSNSNFIVGSMLLHSIGLHLVWLPCRTRTMDPCGTTAAAAEEEEEEEEEALLVRVGVHINSSIIIITRAHTIRHSMLPSTLLLVCQDHR
jgi:hypothetical protein